MRRFIALSSLLVFLSACSGPQLLNLVAPKLRGEWERQTDIAYGPLERQKLDIYKPASEGPYPVLLFIHGGSWERGDKEDYPWLGRRFASEGYLTAVMNYRLAPEFGYPDFMADAAKAVAFIHENAGRFGGDPDTLFLAGHSAGGYNAVQVALAPEFLQAEGTSPEIIDAVVGIAGPYSFLPLDGRVTKAAFGMAEDLEATQPVNRISADAPPMLLLHGRDDNVVKPRNAERMAELLKEAGVEAEAILYDDIDHIEIIVAVALTGKAPVVADMNRFLAEASRP
jgi:acetyl esterase/lipase